MTIQCGREESCASIAEKVRGKSLTAEIAECAEKRRLAPKDENAHFSAIFALSAVNG